jgi:hypothetical protein
LAILLGVSGNASGAFNHAAAEVHYEDFLLWKTKALEVPAFEIADPTRGNGVWVYDGASGVPFYVRQNRNPLSPPSAPVQRRLQGPPAKSNFLAVSHLHRRLQTHHHRLQPEENTRLYEQKLKKAGCFVMITNIAKDKLSAREVLKTYKQQYGVEKNFSFLKEPLIANDTFLKKPSRIDALTFILLVSLMIWNLMQRDLRKSEQVRAGQLHDLNKRPTKRPTSYLLMCQLSGVIILKNGNARHLPRNGIKPQGLLYLEALGFDETIYTTPPPPSKTQRRP